MWPDWVPGRTLSPPRPVLAIPPFPGFPGGPGGASVTTRSSQGPQLPARPATPRRRDRSAVPFLATRHKFPWLLVSVFTTQIPAALRTWLPEARAHCSPKSQMGFLVWAIDLDQDRERATLPSLWEQSERAAPPAPVQPHGDWKENRISGHRKQPCATRLLLRPPAIPRPCSTVRWNLSNPPGFPKKHMRSAPEPVCAWAPGRPVPWAGGEHPDRLGLALGPS